MLLDFLILIIVTVCVTVDYRGGNVAGHPIHSGVAYALQRDTVVALSCYRVVALLRVCACVCACVYCVLTIGGC